MKLVVSAMIFLFSFAMAGRAAAADKDCMMSRAVGLTEAESTAVEDVVCASVREHAPAGTKHWVRVSSIGGRIVLTLIQDRAGVVSEKQAVLTDIEEVAVATPRLVEALAEEKVLADTQTMTNIIAAEARKPKKKPSEMHATLGIIGVGSFSGAATGGAQFSVTVGSPTISFVGDLRVAGDIVDGLAKGFTLGIVELSEERSFGYASLASGARHHFSDHDIAPFVGVGLALDAISVSADGRSAKNSGMAGYVEAGVDLLRTSTLGGTLSARVDAPAFELKGTQIREDRSQVQVRTYAPVVAATFALRF